MTSPPDEDTSAGILRALGVLAYDGQDSDARALLAASKVLVPADPRDEAYASTLKLTMTGRSVEVFTSEERMALALPDVQTYHLVPLGLLPAHWPEGGRSLTIDPGSPDSLTLSADGVRLLLGEP
ncbi:SseB family protein [Streptomyces ureilyticus]|uniref:SseB family protein n=1 Tax=Streptomyces ureilyticus TaxID=1775131 RepID=A0ABX0DIH4_9ACTN|nr:SseB family protein [Streptomyces ureilyticus]NGO41613.1 SseB family protein [Streptomyces ureilyticus]